MNRRDLQAFFERHPVGQLLVCQTALAIASDRIIDANVLVPWVQREFAKRLCSDSRKEGS